MTRSSALMVLPSGTVTGREDEALNETAALLAQGIEDVRLAIRVEMVLRATGHRALCNAEVTVQERVVTLTGRVPSYFLKQLAQTAAGGVTGIERIQNDLAVV